MSVYVMGDIHGNFAAIERWLQDFANTGDVLIQVGDFGVGFVHEKRIESLANKFSEAGCKCLVVQGNHDDPIYFKENKKYSGSLELLPPTSFRQINNKGILFLGGAISVDRYMRIEGKSWWRDEKFILERDYLSSLQGIDYVISHGCPNYVVPIVSHKGDIVDYFSEWDTTLVKELKEEGEQFAEAFKLISNNNIQKAWHGHYHTRQIKNVNGIEFRCLEIDEVDLLF
jgi:predicted phosphodiesterase